MKVIDCKKFNKNIGFYNLVYEIVERIPFGRITIYGAIAESLGLRSSARMVSLAMNNSHFIPKSTPAHRVVNRSGLLTGRHHFTGEKSMEELFIEEGILVQNYKVVILKTSFGILSMNFKNVIQVMGKLLKSHILFDFFIFRLT